ncbi:hypothetical protein [Sphingomonas aerophila]|uniref:Uncharacterized protein n=1 Tax=Sphingomonas aerophila TaxID=1344948 RepID=A0A7W9BH58_9SPHN|nr:hypothetical protein [Sphingomonas aerophila]MBB5717063.1 hypothetical protein [Sphingomonas aerophila]
MTESLSIARNFVADARFDQVALFKPEDVVLESYNFVPFVRNGLAGAIVGTPPGGSTRAIVKVSFDVSGSGVPSQSVERELTLYGPGDVVGIDPGQIIRREPAPGSDKSEDTFMAQIEFDRPDLPWMFSPLGPDGNRLEPWLALVVCERARSDILPPASPDLPHILSTELGELQSLEDNAYFAHAQIVGGPKEAIAANPAVADRLSEEHALANLSRLVCPRNLEARKGYRAVLVPAFNCGVKAGLGLSGGTLEPAWLRAPDAADAQSRVQVPAYATWDFDTGPQGDFKLLAERLQPIRAPWQIGRRLIDGSQPSGGIEGPAAGTPGALQVLRCALLSPAEPPPDAPPEQDGWPAPTRDALRMRVDAANADAPLLPRVGPRLYARFQAARNAIGPVFGTPPADTAAAEKSWFNQLNTDPLARIVAGLGTRVIQKDQEQLMQAAWAQVSEINKLNHQIQQHQFAKVLNESHMRRRVAVLRLDEVTRLTRPVHERIRIAARPESLWKQVDDSRTAGSSLSLAARRVTSQSAPAMRKAIAKRDLAEVPSFVADAAGFRDQRRAYANPDGISGFGAKGLDVLGPELVGRVLGVAPDAAFATLKDRVQPLAAGTGIARLSGGVADWGVQADRPVGGLYADYLTKQIDDRVPAPDDSAGVLRAELAGAALAGLAQVNAPEFSQASAAPIGRLAAAMPAAVIRREALTPIQPSVRVVSAAAMRTVASRSSLGSTPIRDALDRTGTTVLSPRGPIVVRPGPDVAPAAPAVTSITRFDTPLSREVTRTVSDLAAAKVGDLARSFDATVNGMALPPARDTSAIPALTLSTADIAEALAPTRTMTAYLKGRIRRWPHLVPADWFDDLRIDPVMAAPVFPRPMYEALDSYDREWLVPGLGTIAEPEFVTLLQANPTFCETFLTGLSDEMGRELLWRNYPTDQRGTYFKRFWDAEQDELIRPIHRFGGGVLGSHISLGGTAEPNFTPIVLVIRGAIVRRYPQMIVASVVAEDDSFPPRFLENSEAEVLFQAHLQPDYLLVGFKLSIEQVDKRRWFLLAEHPTAPRFGMAAALSGNPRSEESPLQQGELDWNDLTELVGGVPTLDRGRFLAPHARTLAIRDEGSVPEVQQWPGSSAVVARTLLRDPVRAAFQGTDLFSQQNPGSPHA